jgi:septum formation protein
MYSGALIIGSDQVADCDGRPIGKPGNHEAAFAMLTALSGRTVVFHTGLALLDTATGRCATAMVDVRSTFRRLGAEEIGAYLARERPYDCAGAVRSEGLGIALFEAIESDDPTALIGLPLIRLCGMLRDAGVPVLAPRP